MDALQLGENIIIGPYCYLDGNIKIDSGTVLKSHISITGNTSIGKDNIFYPFSNIGCDPQDLKFSGEDSDEACAQESPPLLHYPQQNMSQNFASFG